MTEENPVRAIDAYEDSIDLAALGFKHTSVGQRPGQPAYPPEALIKLYLYGYLNHIRSSRKLEKETQRNLEVIWLMQGLRPSYKTKADFRKDNLKALKGVNKDFLQVCKELGLFGGEIVWGLIFVFIFCIIELPINLIAPSIIRSITGCEGHMKTLKPLFIVSLVILIGMSLNGCGDSKKSTTMLTPEIMPSPTALPTTTPTKTPVNEEYKEVFESVWNIVNETFFDPDFGGLDWDAVHREYEPLVLAAEDDQTFFQLLNNMLWELNVSHAAVGPVDGWLSAEPVVWAEGEIGIDVRLLDNQAVVTRLKIGSPAENAGLQLGYILESIDGILVEQIIGEVQGNLSPPYNAAGRIDGLTRHLLGLIYGVPGTCVRLTYLDEKDELHEGCVERIQRPRAAVMAGMPLPPSHLEFESGILGNEIGYIRFNTFHQDLIPEMIAAVTALQDAPGIIIDLRGNPGGNPDTAEELATQFLDGQVLFGSFRTRYETIDRIVNGKNVYTGPIIILMDALSYSASEWFGSGMQVAGRAVIIGERSPGGATAMNVESLTNDILLGYPVAQLLAPDGTQLEGHGVIPDLIVSLDRGQLLEGEDAQLEAAINYILQKT